MPVFDLVMVLLIALALLGVALGHAAQLGDEQLEASRVYDHERAEHCSCGSPLCACGLPLLMHERFVGVCDGCVAQPRIPQETRR